MTTAELRRAVKRGCVSAQVVSDGSRHYFVELMQPQGQSILKDKRGKVQLFASLSQARELLTKANISTISLSMRIAADEACAGPIAQRSGFANLPLGH